nr:TIR domain-containing protein [uncultured Kordia sp.]
MLLGNHASGKSTLLKYLQTKDCSKLEVARNTSTHIFSTVPSKERINYNLPKAIFYDFGGQDYYNGIYQALLTLGAINILVWTPKSDSNSLLKKDNNDNPIQNRNRMYWLSELQYYFQKQNDNNYNNPILLIQTHADEDNSKQNLKLPYKEYNIIDEFHLSFNLNHSTLRNKAALNYLKVTLWDIIEVQSSKKIVPIWYPNFLNYIINKKSSDAISLNTIVKYYKREGLSIKDKKKYLREDLEQLAHKGLIIYYKNDYILNDVAWLNPTKTISKIYRTVLNRKNLNNGRISYKKLSNLNIDDKTIKLLLNEKIIFKNNTSSQYIVPSCLPIIINSNKNHWLESFLNTPAFVLKFKNFIPRRIIILLTQTINKSFDIEYYREDQLLFHYTNNFIVWIVLDSSKLTITVRTKTKNTEEKKNLNKYNRYIFIEILLAYWQTKVQINKSSQIKKYYEEILAQIGIPKDLYISIDGKIFVYFMSLIDSNNQNSRTFTYSINENDLIENLSYKHNKSKYKYFLPDKNIKLKKIFISYSRKDVEYKDELRKHLNMLKLFDVADNWSCEDITIGKWHDQIQKELEESDLVIFMLSINFFNSRYIIENEVLETMNSIANGKDKKVYCIIVSEFPRLEKFDKESMDTTQQKILELGDYQFGMYIQERNETTGNKEEYIISLKEAKRKGILDGQLTKITEKILEEIQKS